MLGKIIGVYLGRPFEGWTYEQIMAELGEIKYYVHEKRGVPLIVTDDDISGTFTFLRALPDYGNRRDLTARADRPDLAELPDRAPHRAVVGRAGQLDRAHRLPAAEARHPRPAQRLDRHQRQGGRRADRRADLHRRLGDGRPGRPGPGRRPGPAGRIVSHDGEAIYGAQVLAAMEAQAFVEPDIDKLLDSGVSFIPKDSVIYRMIADLREWHAEFPTGTPAASRSWRTTATTSTAATATWCPTTP